MKSRERQAIHRDPRTKEAADKAWQDFVSAEVEANAEADAKTKRAYAKYKRTLDKLAKETK